MGEHWIVTDDGTIESNTRGLIGYLKHCEGQPLALIKAAPDLLSALAQINDWCAYATEEDTSARLLALQQIGMHARAALAKVDE